MGHSGKVLFMRVFLAVLILIFSFQSLSKAEDISDFEIEGMSIGESILNYISEEDINQNKTYFYKSKKFASTSKQDSSFEIYESVQFHFIDNDKNYLIHALDGHITYENNIEDCYKKRMKSLRRFLVYLKMQKKEPLMDINMIMINREKAKYHT